MHRGIRSWTGSLLVAAAALSSCTSRGSSGAASTVTVTMPGPTSSHRAPASTAAPTSSPAPRPSPTRSLGGDCDTIASRYDVEQATGLQLAGRTAFVVGLPQKSIGRLAYLNCRYGIPPSPAGAAPKIEVGISLYASPAQAQRRIQGTIADYLDHGAARQSATVSGHPAAILVGSAAGYDVPLLVVAAQQRTVAVSVVRDLVAAGNRTTVMSKIAALVLARTDG